MYQNAHPFYGYFSLYVCSTFSVGYMGYSYLLATINNVAMNAVLQRSLSYMKSVSLTLSYVSV
jgi:hypothetical protein